MAESWAWKKNRICDYSVMGKIWFMKYLNILILFIMLFVIRVKFAWTAPVTMCLSCHDWNQFSITENVRSYHWKMFWKVLFFACNVNLNGKHQKKNAEWGRWIQAIQAKHFFYVSRQSRNKIYDLLEAIVVIFVVRLCSTRQFHLTLFSLSETNIKEKRRWVDINGTANLLFVSETKEKRVCNVRLFTAILYFFSFFLFWLIHFVQMAE